MRFQDAVLEKHPNARNFLPVHARSGAARILGRRPGRLLGWTFEVPEKPDYLLSNSRFGWVTCDSEVTRALDPDRRRAADNLRAYVADHPGGEGAQS